MHRCILPLCAGGCDGVAGVDLVFARKVLLLASRSARQSTIGSGWGSLVRVGSWLSMVYPCEELSLSLDSEARASPLQLGQAGLEGLFDETLCSLGYPLRVSARFTLRF